MLLAREGLATIDERALERLPFGKALRDAEAAAKQEHKNVRLPLVLSAGRRADKSTSQLWKDFDHEAAAAEAAANSTNGPSAPATAVVDYQDIIVCVPSVACRRGFP